MFVRDSIADLDELVIFGSNAKIIRSPLIALPVHEKYFVFNKSQVPS